MKTSRMIVALVLLTGLAGCGMTGQAHTDLDEIRVFVHVEPVRQGTLDRTLELTATVQAGRAVDLLPDMPGKVSSLPVKMGQEVKKGEVLARLDMEMAELQQRQASAAARLAALGLETATREFARAEALHKTGSLTDQMFEQAQAGLEMAELQVTQARAAQGLARKQITGGVL
ncbi:MAG: biotin/lipoyl-binding protein, partial [Deltaproteobacteria bacterium]|nr:biotin/lipoyl-binding protein [Deltaproteobacteria bacterium]